MTKTVWAFVHCGSLVWLLQRSIVIIIITIMYSYCIVLYCIELYLSISIALLTHSLSLSEALPTTAIDTVGVYTPKHYRLLLVKDFSKVPTWHLELDSNPRPSGRTVSSQLMRQHVHWHTCE